MSQRVVTLQCMTTASDNAKEALCLHVLTSAPRTAFMNRNEEFNRRTCSFLCERLLRAQQSSAGVAFQEQHAQRGYVRPIVIQSSYYQPQRSFWSGPLSHLCVSLGTRSPALSTAYTAENACRYY